MKTLRNRPYVVLSVLFWALSSLGPAAVAQLNASPSAESDGYRPVFPLKLSANHRYLVDQNDRPFLIVGDTPQGLMGRLTEQEAEQYFADREAHGFNAMGWIDVVTVANHTPDGSNASTVDGIVPFTGFVHGGTDQVHYDLSKPNAAYFERLDHIVEIAAAHDIFVFLNPTETKAWLPALHNNGLKADYAYGQYLGRRYKKFANVGWLSGNDFNEWRVPADDAYARAVAEGIKSVAPNQLQTVELNYQASCSLDDPTWAPIISLDGAYIYGATYIQIQHCYDHKPVLPVYLLEAHYDLEQVGEPTDYGTPEVLRRQEYWASLSGAAGQFYGNRYTWTLTPGWASYIDTLGVKQLEIWKNFFSALPWQGLVPDQHHETLTAGYGTFGGGKVEFNPADLSTVVKPGVSQSDYATAARTPDGSYIVVYMPTARTITIDMARLRGLASAEWFDPTTGMYKVISGQPFPNTSARQFTPPGKNAGGDSDWVLLLSAAGKVQ
jgi:hypothetical protein